MPFFFEPRLLATTLGSLPHTDVSRATELVLEATPELPCWVQFPKLGESMLRQFNDGLPGLVSVEGTQRFDTSRPGFEEALADFYTLYLSATEELDAEALDAFAIPESSARGLYDLERELVWHGLRPMAIKGQVTGPFTLATNLTDQDFRAAYYDDRLRDVIVKFLGLKARWQVRQLRRWCPRVMIFLDEPSLLGFGSAQYISISREGVIRDLNEVAAAIHEEGALVGVHCEENTDWSLLMACDLDILDFDAFGHLQSFLLYPADLHAYLGRGGSLGWGLVPTLDREAAAVETAEGLAARFEQAIEALERRGFSRDLLLRRALITPSCGAGALSEELAERVLQVLHELSLLLRERHA
ncbi:MAG: uroporphyrinogen decarboxylase/cobalamine-independent methonine synthase family protein [Chloroflexota bacterium]